MSNNKQSSVEWLDRWFRDNPEATHEEGNAALEQAKAMHKQEVRGAYMEGSFAKMRHFNGQEFIMPTQYYNETFGE